MKITKKEINDLINERVRKDFNYIYEQLQQMRNHSADLEVEIAKLKRNIQRKRERK